MEAYIIIELVLWWLKCVEQARAASESMGYAVVIKWVGPENPEPVGFSTNSI